METTTLSFENMHEHGPLFANMLRARHDLFIRQNGWQLPEAMGMEFDQYDTPASRWVVVHDADGTVLAGNRLTPTTARCGIYSYMIRDAQRGLLETIPSDLLYEEAPVSAEVWESSRLFVSQAVPAAQRQRVYAQLVVEIAKAAHAMGATYGLTLLSATWPRWSRRVGVQMEAMGPVMTIEGVKNQVVAMRIAGPAH